MARGLRLLSVAFAASSRLPRAEANGTPLFSKSVYDAAAKCARLGWFVRRRQFLKPTSSSGAFLSQQGRDFELHVLANAPLAPNTVELPPDLPVAEAAVATRAMMEQAVRDFRATGEGTAILQPTFLAGSLVARADAIVLGAADGMGDLGGIDASRRDGPDRSAVDGGGAGADGSPLSECEWDVIEVKSVLATNGNGKVADLAFTVHVAEAAGVRVRDAMLYAVNPEYRLGTAASVPLYSALNLTLPVQQLVRTVLERGVEAEEAEAKAAAEVEVLSALLADEASAELGGKAGAAAGDLVGGGESEVAASAEAAAAFARLDLSVAHLEGVTAQPAPAEPRVILGCKGCPAVLECTGKGVRHPIWELPRVGAKVFAALAEATPSLEVSDIADASALTLPQRRFRAAVLRGDRAPVAADAPAELAKALHGLRLPIYYLDFEAAGLLFPPFDGLAPYENILTQYSVHRLDEAHVARAGGSIDAALRAACAALERNPRPGRSAAPAASEAAAEGAGGAIAHAEYLADAARDCREELLLRLLDDLGEPARPASAAGSVDAGGAQGAGVRAQAWAGSVLVYSAYEATQLARLAAEFPQHSARTMAARARLVDLEPLVRQCTSHALFRGRSSLKIALPTLAPHMATKYETDAIGDGGAAAASFAQLAAGVLGPEEALGLREQLLEYCALDTRAMVELHRALLQLVAAEPKPDSASSAATAESARPAAGKAARAPAGKQPASAAADAVAARPGDRLPGGESGEIERLLVRELKEQLGQLGQPRTGNKAELVARLKAARRNGVVL